MTNPIQVLQEGAGTAPTSQRGDADRATVARLAQQFEALLLSQMLREMRDSMVPENEEEGFGGAVFADTISTELGLALSRAGGIGLTESLERSLSRLASDQPVAGGTVPEQPAAATPPAVDVAAPPSPVPGAAISSDFGWRTDPIHGQHRFHAGVDLRVAYGAEVRAAAAGVVTFAGEQAGYGLTLVVEHGGGLESRYAHLSTVDVVEGAVVRPGQAVARSGNSGRTTGAHLHFEVRRDGRPVDPAAMSGLSQVADLGRRGDD